MLLVKETLVSIIFEMTLNTNKGVVYKGVWKSSKSRNLDVAIKKLQASDMLNEIIKEAEMMR